MTKEELERGQKILQELISIESLIKDIENKKFELCGFFRLPEELRFKWIAKTREVVFDQQEVLRKEFLSL